MNAPDPVTFYQLLSREQLAPSLSQVQARRRARFDQTALQQLAETIASAGIIEPIIVRLGRNLPAPAEYEIVAGERRWLAAGIAGLASVPVLVREMSDAEMLKLQLVENLQREGLHPLEEAEGFRELMALEQLNADAVGCGADLALGALHATKGKPTKERVVAALEAAEAFSAGVRRPFQLEKAAA